MGWIELDTLEGLEAILEASHARPQLVFKHSTRCGISMGAKQRLDGGLAELGEKFDLHFLDLISHRDVSNQISAALGIRHESPQVIVVDQGKASFHTSHGVISPAFILKRTTT